jgi:hypothetical protein
MTPDLGSGFVQDRSIVTLYSDSLGGAGLRGEDEQRWIYAGAARQWNGNAALLVDLECLGTKAHALSGANAKLGIDGHVSCHSSNLHAPQPRRGATASPPRPSTYSAVYPITRESVDVPSGVHYYRQGGLVHQLSYQAGILMAILRAQPVSGGCRGTALPR